MKIKIKALAKPGNKSWYLIENKTSNEVDIFIYEEIGFWGVKAGEFVTDLQEIEADIINLHINTPGGLVFDGFAIANALKKHKATVNTFIEGIAASIGSIIALAGDTVNIHANAYYMIHNPMTMAMGDSKDLERAKDLLDKLTDSLAEIYANKTGKTVEEIKNLMNDETWFNAEEAKAEGFVDNIVDKEDGDEEANFDLSVFDHAPTELLENMAANATKPSIRNIEEALKQSGLSKQNAKILLSEGYKGILQRDAGNIPKQTKANQRDADKNNNLNNINNKGDITMKCKHCGKDHADGTICNCAASIAEATGTVIAQTPTPAVVVATLGTQVDPVAVERVRTKNIIALGKQHNLTKEAIEFVENGKTVDEFKDRVLTSKGATPVIDQTIDMPKSDLRKYSIVEAMKAKFLDKPLPGVVKEASDTVAKLKNQEANGFFMPHDVLMHDIKNDMSAGNAPKGGYTVGTDVLGGSLIELLRNKMLLSELGMTMLTGLTGNISIPKVDGGATSYWLPETGEVPESDQNFTSVGLTPHRLVGDTAYSKELIMQSSIDVEAFVRNDLVTVLALAKQLAALDGTGNDGQPLGLMRTDGINTLTFGGAPTWADAVDFETKIASDNADVDGMAYITTAAVRGKWKTTAKVSAQPIYLWENTPVRGEGSVNGYMAKVTNQVPGNRVIFGDFTQLIMALWAGIDIVVDPFSLKKKGQIEITLTEWVDFALRHPESFTVSTDAGNQA